MLYLRLDLQSFRDDRTVIYWCGGTNLPDSRHVGKSKKNKASSEDLQKHSTLSQENNSNICYCTPSCSIVKATTLKLRCSHCQGHYNHHDCALMKLQQAPDTNRRDASILTSAWLSKIQAKYGKILTLQSLLISKK